MKLTGEDIINLIVDRLTFEDVRCYDSAIVNKLRSLNAEETQQLFGLGNVIIWHNEKINAESKGARNERI